MSIGRLIEQLQEAASSLEAGLDAPIVGYDDESGNRWGVAVSTGPELLQQWEEAFEDDEVRDSKPNVRSNEACVSLYYERGI